MNEHGVTPLFIAAHNGYLAVVEALLGRGAAVDQAAADGVTPLCIAAHQDHLAVVEVLLDQGATVDQADIHGATPLFIAAGNGLLAVVEALLLFVWVKQIIFFVKRDGLKN